MPQSHNILLALPCLCAMGLAGCTPPAENAAWRYHHGYVLMLPGVEGGTWMLAGTIQGLRDAGVPNAIEAIEWGDRPFMSIPNLIDEPRNRRRARVIAETLVQTGRRYPEAPRTLIGFSGGGGLAAFVAEALPDDRPIDRIIMIAAALAPDYDLCPALEHTKLGLVSFNSGLDMVMLGLGTSVWGTMDRTPTESAGKVGFNTEALPCDASRIEQVFWRSEWIRLGHDGGHGGWLARDWAREVLAAYIPTKDVSTSEASGDHTIGMMRLAPMTVRTGTE
jgi:pimeloyl-ACP methyl ester carboxylesterase